ncbi:MAG: hypothetical protein LBJ44_01905 [Propionibacteriaceae bacterium]|nr:hypothetical protein [Propionibacteriaceae bacterium]
MDIKQLVLNTLVYADQIKAGQMTQMDCLDKATDFGIGRVELRRELLDTPPDGQSVELAGLRRRAEQLGVELYYSVPEGLCQADGVNPAAAGHLEEALALGATHIKWNVGLFTGQGRGLAELVGQGVAAGLRLDVENDQSDSGGTLEAVQAILDFAERNGIDLGLTFDVGNWRIRGYDPVEVAARLTGQVRYIHLKDIAVQPGPDAKLTVAPVGQGSLDLAGVLANLPSDLPVAYEFRVPSDQVLAQSIAVLFGPGTR